MKRRSWAGMLLVATTSVLSFVGFADEPAAGIQSISAPEVGNTEPTRATILATVDGLGDVYAEFAHDRTNHSRSARDCYVTNGLIAMWDGVDNVGRGSHVAETNIWRDLTGNHADMTFTAPPTIGANYYDLSAGGGGVSASDIGAALNAQCATVEIVCNPSDLVNDGTLFACVDGTDQTTGGAGNRLAWVRCYPLDNLQHHGVVAVMEYKASGWANINPNFDQATNSVRSYTFKFGTNCKVYRNGSSTVGVTVQSSGVSGNAANAWFSLGQRVCKAGAGVTANSLWGARIHAVRVYNRELTAEEVAANYEADRRRFFSPQAIDLDNPGETAVERQFVGTVMGTTADVKDYYAQNGLIAMWDGEDNQGTGTHVADATTWKDLVGTHADMTFTAPPTVGDNYYDLSAGGGGVAAADIGAAINGCAATVEVVCDVRELVDDGTVFACVDGTGSGAGNRIAWVRSGRGGYLAQGVVAVMDYKDTKATAPFACYDMTTNAISAYSFRFARDAVRVYKNGAASAGASSTNRGVSCTSANAWFSLGQRVSMGGSSAPILKVRIYCVRVYNRELTAEEVAGNHEADVRRFFGTTNEWPIGTYLVRNAEGIPLACANGRAAFALTGLRPDVAYYTARLTSAGDSPVRSSAVTLETAAERPLSTWYESLDSCSNHYSNGQATGNQGAYVRLNFTPTGRVPVVKARYQILGGKPNYPHYLFGTGGNHTWVTLVGRRFDNGEAKLRYVMGNLDDSDVHAGVVDLEPSETNGVHDLSFNGPDGLVLNGRVRDASLAGVSDTGTTPWMLFGRYIKDNEGHNYIETSSVRVWSFKLWADGQPIRDLVPACYVDGCPCMFDRVSKTFFPNQSPSPRAYPFVRQGELPGMTIGACSTLSGRVLATVVRSGTDASDVYVAWGDRHGGASPSAWEHFEQLPAGFAEGVTSLDVNVGGGARTSRYIRFFSYADGWSDSVYMPDAQPLRGLTIIVK